MNIYDIVQKLIGPTIPVGETNTDDARFENLKELTDLVNSLLSDIDSIAYEFKDRYEFSVKRAVDHCDKFLDDVGIEKDGE